MEESTSYWTSGPGRDASQRSNDNKNLPRFFFVAKNVHEDVMNSKDSSKTKAVQTLKIFSVLSGSGLSLFWLIPLGVLSIAMIVIGALYLHRCEAQHFIPIWLIVYGCGAIFHLILAIVRTIVAVSSNSHEHGVRICVSYIGSCTEMTIGLFLFAWLIAGSVWVFKFYILWHSPLCTTIPAVAACLCDRVPLLFAFSCIIILYIVGLFSCILSCCCCCCVFSTATAALGEFLDSLKNSKSKDSEESQSNRP